MMQEIQESKVELRQNRQHLYLELEFRKNDLRFAPKNPRNWSKLEENPQKASELAVKDGA